MIKKLKALSGALALAALLASPLTIHAAGRTPQTTQVPTQATAHTIMLRVLEYPTHSPEKTVYLPDNATTPHAGSYYVFDYPLYNAIDNTSTIGKALGVCTYVNPTVSNCSWSLEFKDGSQLEVQGAAPDTVHKYHNIYTVTGGTGRYSTAHGTVQSDRFSDDNHAAYQLTIDVSVTNPASTLPTSHATSAH